MKGVSSGERNILCAYMAGREGMVRLRMPFEEEHLIRLMEQEKLPELVVFLDQHVNPVLVIREGLIQFCKDDMFGKKVSQLLEKRKEGGDGRHCSKE